MTTNEFVLAADIGGTHITAALVDMAHRQLVLPSLARKHVDANAGADAIIKDWTDCLVTAKSSVNVSKICLAMPGPFDYEKGVSLMQGQGKYDSLYNCNIKELLANAMQTDANQFFTENDAACFLQGEVFAGCATDGYTKVIGVTLGTGLGTAVSYNGRSHSADLWSFPFGDSIAEDYLSTRWFVKRYRQLSGNATFGVKEIAHKAVADAAAQTVFSEFGKNLASFLQSFIQQESPDAVVIAGNIANAYQLFQQELEEGLQDFPAIHLKQSLLGEQAALLGAAGSWYSIAQKQLSLS
jgi:glucokinase